MRAWFVGVGVIPFAISFIACSSSSNDTSTNTDDGGTDGSVADAGPDVVSFDGSAPCNPITQDCPDPSLKCTILKSGTTKSTHCVAPGTYDWIKQEGELCDEGAAEGDDDCAKGLICFPNGSDVERACVKFCSIDSECGAGGKCAATTNVKPYYGNCYKTCDAFSDACGDAGSCASIFQDNDGVGTVQTCRSLGPGAAGAPCSEGWDCQANLDCYGTSGFKCSPQCDSTHDCGDGGATCVQLGLSNQAGVCQ